MNPFSIDDNLRELFTLVDRIRIQFRPHGVKNFNAEIETVKSMMNRQRAFRVLFEDLSSIRVKATDIESGNGDAKHSKLSTTLRQRTFERNQAASSVNNHNQRRH